MVKKFEAIFGGGEAMSNTKKMLTIFVMVASLALVATLASVQTSLASCEVVQITNPTQGANLNGKVTMTGYALYGAGRPCASIQDKDLSWYVQGFKVGTGKSFTHDFSQYYYCTGAHIELKAKIPGPGSSGLGLFHTISTTIWVKGPQPC